MSNWNVLSVEAALQQLNAFDGDDPEKIMRRPNTVSVDLLINLSHSESIERKRAKVLQL